MPKKYTDKQRKFISDNLKSWGHKKMSQHLKINRQALSALLNKWRRDGFSQEFPKYVDLHKSKTEGYKFCVKCKEDKPVKEFYSNNFNKDGKSTYCKGCHNSSCKGHMKKYVANNRETINKKSRERYRQKVKANSLEGSMSKTGRLRGAYAAKQKVVLDDDSMMPDGAYTDCKMMNVPAWYLLKMYNADSCSEPVRNYIESNMEYLKLEAKKQKG